MASGQPAQWIHSSDVIRATEYRANVSIVLELSDLTWMREHKYVLVSGVVTNVSDSPIKGLVADVDFLDAQGGFVNSEFARTDSNPIAP